MLKIDNELQIKLKNKMIWITKTGMNERSEKESRKKKLLFLSLLSILHFLFCC